MDKNLTRLEEYIQSNGKRIPRDFREYDSTQKKEKSHLCVFCTTVEHDNIFLYNRDIHGKLSNTFSSICSACSMQIDTRVDIHAEALEEEYDTGTPITGGAWGDDYYDHEAKSNSELDWTRHVPLKLLDFMNEAKYAQDVKTWLLELDSQQFKYIKDRNDTYCYFCDERSEGRAAMFVPVDNGDELSGGNVRICTTCHDIVKEQFIDIPFAEATCPHCSRDYYITYEEKDQRATNNSEGLHLCPPCTYSQLTYEYAKQNTSLGKLKLAKFPYTHTPKRYITRACKVCYSNVVIDLSIIASVYEEYNLIESLLCCNNCKDAQKYITEYGEWCYILVSAEALEQGIYYTLTLVAKEDDEDVFGGYVSKGFDLLDLVSKLPINARKSKL